MVYSCAFFVVGDTLETAQGRKLKTTAARLDLTVPGLSVLDIGCGWGALTRLLAKDHAAHVTGLSLAQGQIEWCNMMRAELPLAGGSLSYHCQDYKDFGKPGHTWFDRIVSVGMFEHIGIGQYGHFFRYVHDFLKPGGKVLVHTIVRPQPGRENPWLDRYIFPNGYIPSLGEILNPAEASGLLISDVFLHSSHHYRITIREWRKRYQSNFDNSPLKENPTMRRMLDFYLASVEQLFDDSTFGFQVAQLKLTKPRVNMY